MIVYDIELAAIAICLCFLFFLSLVEGAITQSSPLVLRMMAERQEKPMPSLFPLVLEDKMQILTPLHFGIQVFTIITAVLITHLNLVKWQRMGLAYALVIILIISVIFRQLLPWLLTQNDPEKKLGRLLSSFKPFYAVLRPLSMPLSDVMAMCERREDDVNPSQTPESEENAEQEMQAYLDIGEDEGILQKEDTKLIQSVVEFSNTLVREVMTPRMKIVACAENATIAELRETMVQNRHSRIPIYREDLDHIIGITYIRQLIGEYAKGRESDPISGLVNPVMFVPETKQVSKLLKELQQRGDHTAIVIDEFGGVTGLVTIEDLIEEIIGEIHDEDEARISKIIEEGSRCFVMRGSTELYRFEELANKKLDGMNCSTIAGLVVAFLGRVPAPGEAFDWEDIGFQIVDADRKRIHWIRVRFPEPKPDHKNDE